METVKDIITNTAEYLKEKDITEYLKGGEIYKIITQTIFIKPQKSQESQVSDKKGIDTYFIINNFPLEENNEENEQNEKKRCACYVGNHYTWECNRNLYEYNDKNTELLYCYLPEPEYLGALTAQCTNRGERPVFFTTGRLSSCVACAILLENDILLVHVGSQDGKSPGRSYQIKYSIILNAVIECLNGNKEDKKKDCNIDELIKELLKMDKIKGVVITRQGEEGEIERTFKSGDKFCVDHIYENGGLTALINSKGIQILAGDYGADKKFVGKCKFHCLMSCSSERIEGCHNQIKDNDSETDIFKNSVDAKGDPFDNLQEEPGCCRLL